MTSEIKYFTPKEAKKTLPLVKQIVQDILESVKEIKLLADDAGGEDIQENEQIKFLIEKINNFLIELEEIGCYFKDWNFSIGLVDFPSVIEGEDVFLCWRSDEDDILYYHSEREGFQGRKMIPAEYI
jgi:hypothetical protein